MVWHSRSRGVFGVLSTFLRVSTACNKAGSRPAGKATGLTTNNNAHATMLILMGGQRLL